MAVPIGDVYVDVIPNMAQFTASVDEGISAAGAQTAAVSTEAVAAGTVAGSEEGAVAAAASPKVQSAWKSMAGLAAGYFVYSFVKSSLSAYDSYNATVLALKSSLEKANLAAELPDLQAWAQQFSLSTGLAQTDIITLMGSLAAAGVQGTSNLENITNAVEGLAFETHRSVTMWTKSVIPSIINAPASALVSLQKWNVLTVDQVAQVKALVAAGQSQSATQLELNALMVKGENAYKGTEQAKYAQAVEELKIKLGELIHEALTPLIHIIEPVIAWFAKGSEVSKIVMYSVIGLTGAFVGLKVAMALGGMFSTIATALSGLSASLGFSAIATEGMTAAQWMLNAALDAMPILAVASGVGLIATHWTTTKNVLVDIWHWIREGWDFLWNLFKTHPWLDFFLGPIGALVMIAQHVREVGQGFVGVWDGIRSAWSDVGSFFDGLWKDILAGFSAFVNFFVRIWNDSVGRIFHGQSIGALGFHMTLPNLMVAPVSLDSGGITTAPVVAQLHPNEAVIPLSSARGQGMLGGAGGGRAELTITNWETGAGYFRWLARDEAAQAGTYAASVSRMGR